MDTQQTTAFSEMEERIAATEWHDKLLHVNAVTMRNEDTLLGLKEVDDILRECARLNDLPIGQEKWFMLARYVGSKLMRLTMGFDVAVQQIVEGALEARCYSKGLHENIERVMMDELLASPYYKSHCRSLNK